MEIISKGNRFTVTSNQDHKLMVETGGHTITADTIPALIRALDVHQDRPKVAIPVTRISEPSWKGREVSFADGVLTGYHSGNGNLIVKWEDRRAPEQATQYDSKVYRRLTKEQRAELLSLRKAYDDAEKALQNWKNKYRIDEQQGHAMVSAEAAKVKAEQEKSKGKKAGKGKGEEVAGESQKK